MRTFTILTLIIAGIFGKISPCQAAELSSCRINVAPEKSGRTERHLVFEFVQKTPLIVCPYSDSQPVTLLDLRCSHTDASKLGRYVIEYFDRKDFFKEVGRCTPLLYGIQTDDYARQTSVKSYMLYNQSEKFEPGEARDSDDKFDRNFRQFLNNLGAPIIYYNGMSNAICLSIRSQDNFDLADAIFDFGFEKPSAISIEASTLKCPDWFKQRFNVSLPSPTPRL